jgi:HlyD family secretion protein
MNVKLVRGNLLPGKFSRRALFWILGVILLLLLNLLRDLRRALKDVAWEPVVRQTLHKSVNSTGVIEAFRVAEIKSQIDEAVIKKFVTEGQAVKEKEPLLELSLTKTQLEYDQKKNALAEAAADYKNAGRECNVQKQLYQNRAVARSQVENAERTRLKSKASLEIARQEFNLVKEKIKSAMVRSPMNGVVLKDETTLGGGVTTGKELMVVGDTSQFIVRAKVDELDIQQIRPDQAVSIEADAYPDQKMMGKVRSIASEAERETFAKVEVLIDIVDAKGLPLKHNLSVRVNILTEDIPNALGVPVKAVRRKEGDKGWVLVRNKFNLVREKSVRLGKPAGSEVEILSGLNEGDKVGIPKAAGDQP